MALINENKNSEIFSPLEVPAQEGGENDEDLPRITEEASRLENTQQEIQNESSIVEQSPQKEYLNADITNVNDQDQAERDKMNLRN